MSDAIILGYLEAKRRILDGGFEEDIHWAERLANVRPTAHYGCCVK